MNVLITGGCGFIGTNLDIYLSKMGYKVSLLDNLSVGRHNGQTNLTVGDVREKHMVEKALTEVDAVVHLAAASGVALSLKYPGWSWNNNVNGLLNLLDCCVKVGVGKTIFASSNAVLGEQKPPLHEGMASKPLSPYGASKAAGEVLCTSYFHSYGLKTTSLRFSQVYGLHSGHKTSVIFKFLKEIRENQSITIYGDGSQTRDFVHVDDICQAIELTLKEDNIGGEVFQIGSGVETSINALVKLLDDKVKIEYEPERPGEIKSNYSDISKAEKLLGYKPEISLEDGLKEIC